jgi:hypothetical protein
VVLFLCYLALTDAKQLWEQLVFLTAYFDHLLGYEVLVRATPEPHQAVAEPRFLNSTHVLVWVFRAPHSA